MVDFERHILHNGSILFVVIGVFANVAVIALRRESETNEPISAFVTNAVGIIFFVAVAWRVSHVVTTADVPLRFVTWVGLLRDGTIQGGVYALIALGYTLVYGILFMINFAHGEVMMFGAYGGWFALMYLIDDGNRSFETGAAIIAAVVVPIFVGIMFLPLESIIGRFQTRRETSSVSEPTWAFSLLSMPVRILIGGMIGYGALVGLGQFAPNIYLLVITIVGLLFVTIIGMLTSIGVAVALERIAYRPFRKAPRLTPLITAIGASIFLQQTALRIFGPARTYNDGKPKLLNDPVTFPLDLGRLGVVPISKVGIVMTITSIGLMALLFFIVQRTKLGRGMRAVAEDKDTAALMGANVDRIIVMTFVLGAGLAGAAGVMLGFRGESLAFRFGFTPGLKAFTAAVLGGIGNIPGAMLGGFFLGLVEAIGPSALGIGNEWKNVIAFSLLVLVIIYRPTGLLGEAASEKKV
jgi:branched-chain amino acid transport system permease protein